MDLLKKAEDIVNGSAMHSCGESGLGADWVMAQNEGDGYPAASMITASKADGFKWIAFCTGVGSNKELRAKNDPRACVYLFDKNNFAGVSLTGKIEIKTDPETKAAMWYDALGEYFGGPEDSSYCVLLFKPERYNIFIENRALRGSF